jgi:hypothetical protein
MMATVAWGDVPKPILKEKTRRYGSAPPPTLLYRRRARRRGVGQPQGTLAFYDRRDGIARSVLGQRSCGDVFSFCSLLA